MKEYLSLGIRLMLFSLIAGLLLAGTNAVTSVEIANQLTIKAEKARAEVLPGDEGFAQVFEAQDEAQPVRSVYKGNGGYVFVVRGQGYGSGGVTVTIGIKGGRVSGVRVDASGETPGLGAKVGDAAYYTRFEGTDVRAAQDVQGVSGATISSGAVKQAVLDALEYYSRNFGG